MALVLLYNIKDEAKRLKIGFAARKLGIAVRSVAPEAFSQPIGTLLGLERFSPADAPEEPFEEEMLLMHDLSSQQFSAFLEALRRGRTPVTLKAVVTGHNVAWSSAALCRELQKEHDAIKRAGKSAHR